MGNACRVSAIDYTSDDENGSIDQGWIIVLQANGEAMKLGQGRRVKAGDLMLQHPHHFLCLASSILVRRKSKMIPAKATLQPGKIYLLLPLPDREHRHDQEQEQHGDDSKNLDQPLLAAPASKAEGTTKFVISKHYLDRILSESKNKSKACGGGGISTSSRSSSVRRSSASISQRKSCRRRSSPVDSSAGVQRRSIVWSPALDSIPEK